MVIIVLAVWSELEISCCVWKQNSSVNPIRSRCGETLRVIHLKSKKFCWRCRKKKKKREGLQTLTVNREDIVCTGWALGSLIKYSQLLMDLLPGNDFWADGCLGGQGQWRGLLPSSLPLCRADVMNAYMYSNHFQITILLLLHPHNMNISEPNRHSSQIRFIYIVIMQSFKLFTVGIRLFSWSLWGRKNH